MGRKRNGRDDASRIQAVRRWRSSGLSGRASAASEGISPATLQRWSALPDEQRKPHQTRSAGQPSDLVEVQVAAGTADSRRSGATEDSELWVMTRSGHEIRMAGGLDRSSLAMVLEVLASC
ncbi:MAG: hypothetical protein GY811_09935 [Myxococcales bacterium]|nr:hypothetical protein [Myxococcales bacterium]